MNIECASELNCQHHKFLLQALKDNFDAKNSCAKQASYHMQFIFCMDRRLERMRRALEEHECCETFGLPGNFSLPATLLDYVATHGVTPEETSLAEKCSYARHFLQELDMHDEHDFANNIIVCGHESSVDGKHFPKGLQCAASHDLSGRFAARSIVALLNDESVRSALRVEGFIIPPSTHFFAAVYNTKTLSLKFDCDKKPLEFDEIIERAIQFVRTQHQSDEAIIFEPMLIVAPRSLSKTISFENRAFLYSYRAERDKNGNLIGKILSTVVPLVQKLFAQSAVNKVEEKQPLVVVLRAEKSCVETVVAREKVIQNLVLEDLVRLFVFDIATKAVCCIKLLP